MGATFAPTPPVPPVTRFVKFVVTSPLCLASVSVKALKLQQLISPPKDGGSRESEFTLATDEELLLAPPSGDEYTPPEGKDLYGEACTDDTNAVFREGDAVELGFKLVGREPDCLGDDLYPWDNCGAYKDASPSQSEAQSIAIEINDGVSGTQSSATYGDETYDYTMHAKSVNPFAPFSNKLSLVFSRAFDGARIQFVRYVLVLGSIPEDVPQVWTTAVEGLIFSIIRDPPGGASTATVRCADGVAGADCLGRSHLITDGVAVVGAHGDICADPLGDLRADAGDDECALLRADHGDLRSIVDADGYGRADDERVKRPPLRQHPTTTTANTERNSRREGARHHHRADRTYRRIPIPIPIAPSPSKKRVPSNLATDWRHYEQSKINVLAACKTLASQTKLQHHHNLRRSSVARRQILP